MAKTFYKIMWALEHIASGRWDNGDSNLTLFWAEHEATYQPECRNGGWRPIKVRVTVEKAK